VTAQRRAEREVVEVGFLRRQRLIADDCNERRPFRQLFLFAQTRIRIFLWHLTFTPTPDIFRMSGPITIIIRLNAKDCK